MAIICLNIDDCVNRCFPYIWKNLQYESAPNYLQESDGIDAIKTILFFTSQDGLYETFPEKASYLFCSVSNRHAFQNGNKRLAATLLRYFLADNGVKTVEASPEQWKEIAKVLFPAYSWKEANVEDAFYLLLYNLAFITADGQLRPGINFDECKNILTDLFENIFDVPASCQIN